MANSFDPNQIGEWLRDGKLAIDFLKGALNVLPRGADRTKATEQVEQAEAALGRSEAAVAKELGFPLCHCTFPPQIMLWKEAERAYLCPRPECGHAIHRGVKASAEAPLSARGLDFTYWDRVETFGLLQAAYLWVEQNPPEKMTNPEGRPREVFRALLDAARRRVLPVDMDTIVVSHGNAEMVLEYVGTIQKDQLTIPVTRSALRAYAESNSERPAFLFPEDRRPSAAPEAAPLDFKDFDTKDSFDLHEAAFLWDDEWPEPFGARPMSRSTRIVLDRLVSAIMDGQLQCDPPYEAGKTQWGPATRLKRAALVTYAGKTGQRPKFLFKRAR
jgi:hypothetical protein